MLKISNIKFCSVLGGHLLGRGGPRKGGGGHGLCGHRDGREVVDNADDLFDDVGDDVDDGREVVDNADSDHVDSEDGGHGLCITMITMLLMVLKQFCL